MSTDFGTARPDTPFRDDVLRVRRNVSWAAFERYLARKGDRVVPRVMYLDGVLELVTPSRGHERHGTWIGALVATWALETEVQLSSFGSWTLTDKLRRAGAEPDNCFMLGDDSEEKLTRPHFVIEVNWSKRGIDKLEVYRRLGVREVWFWQDHTIAVYVLRGDTWQRWKRSACLPALDLARLVDFLDRPAMTDAMRDFRRYLRGASA